MYQMYPINYLMLYITVIYYAEGNGTCSIIYNLRAKVSFILCLHVIHRFQKDTLFARDFNASQLPPRHLQSSQMCTWNDDVIADSYLHLSSQLIMDTIHKLLPPHHLITWQLTLNTLALCSWAPLHVCLARSGHTWDCTRIFLLWFCFLANSAHMKPV